MPVKVTIEREGVYLDQLLFERFGGTSGLSETFRLNRSLYKIAGNSEVLAKLFDDTRTYHLSDLPDPLPVGITIWLPDRVDKSAKVRSVRLWS